MDSRCPGSRKCGALPKIFLWGITNTDRTIKSPINSRRLIGNNKVKSLRCFALNTCNHFDYQNVMDQYTRSDRTNRNRRSVQSTVCASKTRELIVSMIMILYNPRRFDWRTGRKINISNQYPRTCFSRWKVVRAIVFSPRRLNTFIMNDTRRCRWSLPISWNFPMERRTRDWMLLIWRGLVRKIPRHKDKALSGRWCASEIQDDQIDRMHWW